MTHMSGPITPVRDPVADSQDLRSHTHMMVVLCTVWFHDQPGCCVSSALGYAKARVVPYERPEDPNVGARAVGDERCH